MCVYFQKFKFGVQAPLVQIELTVWQKNRGRTKGWSAIHISFWFLLLASSQQHFEMCFHFQNIKFGVQAPLVEIELTVWQKNWGGAKAWSAISYILLISTLSLHGKKGDAAKSIFKMCIHFQNIKFGVQDPLVKIGITVWQKMGAMLKPGQQFHITFRFLLLASMARKACSQKHF